MQLARVEFGVFDVVDPIVAVVGLPNVVVLGLVGVVEGAAHAADQPDHSGLHDCSLARPGLKGGFVLHSTPRNPIVRRPYIFKPT